MDAGGADPTRVKARGGRRARRRRVVYAMYRASSSDTSLGDTGGPRHRIANARLTRAVSRGTSGLSGRTRTTRTTKHDAGRGARTPSH